MKHTAVYIRVSTADKQESGLDSQQSALVEYCQNHSITGYKIYADRQTGGNLDRPALKRMQSDIFRGRVSMVVCWKLDRLSRDLRDGINLLIDWLERDIRVIAIQQNFDLSGAVGKMIMSLLLGISEMERQNIRENIIRGLEHARQRGVKLGGSQPRIFAHQIQELKDGGMNMTQIANELNCSRQALYKAMERENCVST